MMGAGNCEVRGCIGAAGVVTGRPHSRERAALTGNGNVLSMCSSKPFVDVNLDVGIAAPLRFVTTIAACQLTRLGPRRR